jgi:hypothetical protein
MHVIPDDAHRASIRNLHVMSTSPTNLEIPGSARSAAPE